MSHHVEHNYDDPSAPPRLCQNCRHVLRGPYCATCGQHDIDYHRSFWHLTHDLLENLFHFEGKFFTSVAWLLAKPGRLTVEFNAGRRQSQLNPLRFYIFVTVLFFLGVHVLNDGHLFPVDRRKIDASAAKIRDVAKNIPQIPAEFTPEQQERFGKLVEEAVNRGGSIPDPRAIAEIIERIKKEAAASPPASTAPSDAEPAKPAKPKSRRGEFTSDEFPEFARALNAKLASGELTFSRFLDEFEHRVPTLLFLGMPISALLLKLLYLRSRRFYIEHLIFSVHLHIWVFLMFMVSLGYFSLASLGPAWIRTLLGWAVLGWSVWYVFRAFRVVYGQTRTKTIVKLCLLGMSYLFALSTVALTLIVFTVWWLTVG